MALLDVVFRVLDKAGVSFIEPRREDGHGSSDLNPSHCVISDPTVAGHIAEVRRIDAILTDADYGLVTHSVIQGRTTAGGGALLDVKVNPSGSLAVDATDSVITLLPTQYDALLAALNKIDQNTDELELTADNIALNAESINLNTDTLEQGQADILSRLNLTLNVADDYQTGEILPDQTGANNVLTFTFASPVQNVWVYAVNPLDLAEAGEVRVDPFGGNPSATRGIPVGYGGITPIPTTTGSLKVFAPLGARVTVYGNRRA